MQMLGGPANKLQENLQLQSDTIDICKVLDGGESVQLSPTLPLLHSNISICTHLAFKVSDEETIQTSYNGLSNAY